MVRRRRVLFGVGVALSGCLSSGPDDISAADATTTPTERQSADESFCPQYDDPSKAAMERYARGRDILLGVYRRIGHDAEGTEYISMPYHEMQESDFEEAIEGFQGQRQRLAEGIVGYRDARNIAEQCVGDGAERIVEQAEMGIDSCLRVADALKLFIEACEEYEESGLSYEDTHSGATEKESKALSTLEAAEKQFPMPKGRLESEIQRER